MLRFREVKLLPPGQPFYWSKTKTKTFGRRSILDIIAASLNHARKCIMLAAKLAASRQNASPKHEHHLLSEEQGQLEKHITEVEKTESNEAGVIEGGNVYKDLNVSVPTEAARALNWNY